MTSRSARRRSATVHPDCVRWLAAKKRKGHRGTGDGRGMMGRGMKTSNAQLYFQRLTESAPVSGPTFDKGGRQSFRQRNGKKRVSDDQTTTTLLSSVPMPLMRMAIWSPAAKVNPS